ncbi:hypothetical protein C2W59_02097 [Bacillus pumilus]|uniref:Uncharacterized protein n=1 Tax=Bacillus pumilus TaxID=1408 RepID=A0AB34QRZ2_BACPU|nr:hypothetical protein B4127_2025 [Bacillus pumilus]RAP17105.1 hypothetical protein C2W58_00460 [Bacillus pumilus]RAP24580.1 hypothetical protein C2W59_02097 [Bacillus pumilus]
MDIVDVFHVELKKAAFIKAAHSLNFRLFQSNHSTFLND